MSGDLDLNKHFGLAERLDANVGPERRAIGEESLGGLDDYLLAFAIVRYCVGSVL